MTGRLLLATLLWLSGLSTAQQTGSGGAVEGRSAAGPSGPRSVPSETTFERILYMHGGPPADGALAKALLELGFTGISVQTGGDGAFPADNGLSFYLDQVVGKGILELRTPQWQEVRQAYLKGRESRTLVRPMVLADPATGTELFAVLDRNLDRALERGPRFVCLGDEVSVTRHGNPLDLCFAEPTLVSFRDHLRQQFPDVAALNRAWHTRFTDFDVVMPMTADQIRSRELQTSGLPTNLRPWAEHRAFMDREFAALLSALGHRVQSRAPNLPVGLTGIQTPAAYGGHDYTLLLPWMTFFEAYDIGGARDLAMSLAPDHARQVTTIFKPPEGASMDRVRLQVADAIAHGMSGLVVWSAKEIFDGDRQPSAYGMALKHVFHELAPAARAFAGARVVRSPVWIVESQPSVRAWWMLDSIQDGSTWIQRLTSYEATHSTSQATRRSWLRLLEDLGHQGLCVPAEDLPARLGLKPPRLLVLPATIAMSDEACAAVVRYVEAGGVVVADHGPALYDQHLVLRATPALDSLFGIRDRSDRAGDLWVREGKASPAGRLPEGPAAAEASVKGPLAEVVGRHHIQAERVVGKGRAIYLNLAVCEYGEARLDPQQHRTAFALRTRVRRVLELADVEPPVVVRGEGLPTMLERIHLEGRDGRRLLAVRLNGMDAPELVEQVAAREGRSITLQFEQQTVLTDLVRGIQLPAGRRFEVPFDPWVGGFYLWEDAR